MKIFKNKITSIKMNIMSSGAINMSTLKK